MTTFPSQLDPMDPGHLIALNALIGGDIDNRAVLPPLWHWTYFLERTSQADLGPDGHPIIGRPTPPAPGLRRMFAGGRVTHHGLLRTAVPATLRTSASDPVRKEGRTGPLWFVTVRYDYEQEGSVAISEEREIVYREPMPAPTGRSREPRPTRNQVVEVPGEGIDLTVDETLLFRFSALTYNAHRIHYDLSWAAREGYLGLVVHGPLQALMMGELLRRSGHDLVGRTFRYRLVEPFVGVQAMRIRAVAAEDGVAAAVHDARGVVTATALLVDANGSEIS